MKSWKGSNVQQLVHAYINQFVQTNKYYAVTKKSYFYIQTRQDMLLILEHYRTIGTVMLFMYFKVIF